MGTPFITFIEPSQLEGFQRGVPRGAQRQSTSKDFLDVMEVREKAFVEGQNIPAEKEFDADDPRSCHWILYASVRKIVQHEVLDEDGNMTQPRKSESASVPIGAIRVVPFPHDQHPKKNGQYLRGVLKGEMVEKQDGDAPEVASPKTFGVDRATAFHDGQEPYVKLGRLAVLPEYRDSKITNIAVQLVNTAIAWLISNPTYFNPSIKELGLQQMGAATEKEIPKWNGLVCVHTPTQSTEFWKGWGFKADKDLGRWYEDGVPYVGTARYELRKDGMIPERKIDLIGNAV